MRIVILACTLGGCGFTGGGPAPVSHTLIDDTATALNAGILDGAVVDPPGVITPRAYISGLHGRSYYRQCNAPRLRCVDPASEWDLLDAEPEPAKGERYGMLPDENWNNLQPRGLGLVNRTDDFTILYDGEIFLEGTTELALFGDDFGFVQVAIEGVWGSPLRAEYAMGTTPAHQPVVAPHAGWYPIRGALGEGNGNAFFRLGTMGGDTFVSLARDRVRAEVTNASGTLVTGFGSTALTQIAEPSVAHDLDADFRIDPSYDFTGVAADRFSVAYAGQFFVERPGMYTFVVDTGPDTDDGYRLWIDRDLAGGYWAALAPGPPVPMPPAPRELAAGWHDLVLDYSEGAGGVAHVAMSVSGPDGPFAPSFRPVMRFAFATAIANNGGTTIPDATAAGPGEATIMIPVDAPVGATIETVDAGVRFDHAARPELRFAIATSTPDTATLAIPATPQGSSTYDYWSADTSLRGKPVASPWTARAQDTVAGNVGGFAYPYVSLRYRGGPFGPLAQGVTYTSIPHELADAWSIDAIRVIGMLDGAALEIAVRSAPSIGELASQPWTVVTGELALSEPFVQYRLAIAADGWQFPTVDRIEIDYTTGTD